MADRPDNPDEPVNGRRKRQDPYEGGGAGGAYDRSRQGRDRRDREQSESENQADAQLERMQQESLVAAAINEDRKRQIRAEKAAANSPERKAMGRAIPFMGKRGKSRKKHGGKSSGGGGGGLKVILGILTTMVVAWIVMIVLFFGVIGYFTTKIVSVPLLKPAIEAVAKITCLGGAGSDTACKIDDLMDVFEQSGAEDAIRRVWDCSNLKPGESRDTCDPNALGNMEGASAIPEGNRWMMEVYMHAAAEYEMPWELLAAVHGATTNFSEEANCGNNDKGGGQYDFGGKSWDKFKVDAGEEKHDEQDDCWTHKPEEKEVKLSNGEKAKVFIHVKFRDSIDEHPGYVADEDPRDMVDATYAMARMLVAKGAGERFDWDYNGQPAGSCKPDTPTDGHMWAPPILQATGYSSSTGGQGGGGELDAAAASRFDDLIVAAATKYNVPPAIIKAMIHTESTFQPGVTSSTGKHFGLMQTSDDILKEAGYGPKASGGSEADRFDPEKNIDAGSRYIAVQLKYFRGNLMLAAAAYNAGPGALGGGGTPQSGSHLPDYAETQKYGRVVPARAIKYGGWDERVSLDVRYIDASFEEYQKTELGRVEIAVGSYTPNPPSQDFGGGHLGATGGGSGSGDEGGSELSNASGGSGASSMTTPAHKWGPGTTDYTGEPATDKVSKAVRYRVGKDHSDCYVAIVYEWYKTLTGETVGDSGESCTGGAKQSPVRSAILAKAEELGVPHTSGDRDAAHNAAVGGVPDSAHSTARPERWADDYGGGDAKENALKDWVEATYKAGQGPGNDYEDIFRHNVSSGMHLHVEGYSSNAAPSGGVNFESPLVNPKSGMLLVGDSLAVGMTAALKKELEGQPVSVKAAVGLTLAQGMVKYNSVQHKPAVVGMSLFTNDAPTNLGPLRTAIQKTIDDAKARKGRVVWATIVRPAVGGKTYAAANTLIRTMAEQNPEQMSVVDWADTITRNPTWLAADGVHSTTAGYTWRGKEYAAAVKSAGTAEQTEGACGINADGIVEVGKLQIGKGLPYGHNGPRTIAAYEAVGRKTLGFAEANAAGTAMEWDCSAFAGYAHWIGAKSNVIKNNPNTWGMWSLAGSETPTDAENEQFVRGYGKPPPGGFKAGDLVFYNGLEHMEVAMSADKTMNWGRSNGSFNQLMRSDYYGYVRVKSINGAGSTNDPNQAPD